MHTKAVYLPGLNGLRAIAAISVVIAHTMMHMVTLKLTLPVSFPMAQYAVTLFFVISGFLITYLLLIEKEESFINVKNFYIRRILRIWPLYYLFIIVCFTLSSYDRVFHNLASPRIYLYLLFFSNIPFILHKGIDILNHYWSMAGWRNGRTYD